MVGWLDVRRHDAARGRREVDAAGSIDLFDGS
jgi:hypothetical protein